MVFGFRGPHELAEDAPQHVPVALHAGLPAKAEVGGQGARGALRRNKGVGFPKP